MKKVIKLNESDLNNIVSKVISEQKNELPRKTYDYNINKWRLEAYKNKGLTLYYFNPTEGKDFGLMEYTTPSNYNKWDNKATILFALTPEEYSKVNKVVDNIKEMIELERQKLNALKQMVPAIMNELIKKNI
jgi:hypothetical protein